MGVHAEIMRRKRGFPEFNKVFCIGMHKTGTSSLDELYHRIGLRAHHGVTWSKAPIPNAWTEDYDALSDGGGHFWDDSQEFGGNHEVRRLDEAYPGSRFILSVRAMDSWLVSKMMHAGWGEEGAEEQPRAAPGDPPPAHEEWRRRSRDFIGRWIDNRRRYEAKVEAYFADRPEDLLRVDLAAEPDAAERIVDFLGLGPSVVWAARAPRANKLRSLLSPSGRIHLDPRMPRQNARDDAGRKAYCRAIVEEELSERA